MKKFIVPISIREVLAEEFAGTPDSNNLSLFAYDDNFYLKRSNGDSFRILTTEDIIYTTKAINANTAINICPAGYKLKSIVASGSVSDLSIGSSSGGNDIVNSVTVGGVVDLPLGKRVFGLISDQVFYFSGTNWLTTNFYFKLEKIA